MLITTKFQAKQAVLKKTEIQGNQVKKMHSANICISLNCFSGEVQTISNIYVHTIPKYHKYIPLNSVGRERFTLVFEIACRYLSNKSLKTGLQLIAN